jgi:hypothetical protein
MTKKGIPELPPAADGDGAPAHAATHNLQISINDLSVDELLELRTRIDAKLPARKLKDIDLEQELVLQLLSVQALQRRVLNAPADADIPANQMAQVTNAVQAALENLTKLQSNVFKSERLKRIEQILLEVIVELPHEAQEKFLSAYEKRLGQL